MPFQQKSVTKVISSRIDKLVQREMTFSFYKYMQQKLHHYVLKTLILMTLVVSQGFQYLIWLPLCDRKI